MTGPGDGGDTATDPGVASIYANMDDVWAANAFQVVT